MMKYRSLIIGTLACGIVGGLGWFGTTRILQHRAVEALSQDLRDQMVYVEGGRFQMGNFQVDVRLPDGRVEQLWAEDFEPSETRTVSLESYYIAAKEVSYGDFNTYLRAQGYPALLTRELQTYQRPDRGASVSFDEATRYCAWAAEITGLPMRLPNEAEWEYAARSRGQMVPWPTNDGNFRPGENVTLAGDRDSPYEEGNPPMGSFPPNPLGLYNLLDGVYEWVTGHPGSDPEGAGIGKGGSDFSSRLMEGIPGRSIHKRLSDADLEILTSFLRDEQLERHLRKLDPHSPVGGYIGIRCVAAVSAPPAETGFGVAPPDDIQFSPPFYAVDEYSTSQ